MNAQLMRDGLIDRVSLVIAPAYCWWVDDPNTCRW